MRTLPHRVARALRAGLPALVFLLFAGCNGDDGEAEDTDAAELSGTYLVSDADGSMTLEFKDDHKVHFTVLAAGTPPDTATGDYMIDGTKVTVQMPGGTPLVLVREGEELAGNMMGQILRFRKQ